MPDEHGPPEAETPGTPLYDCDNCPSYCCSYPQIEVKPEDLRRLARHFGLDVDTALRRLTKDGDAPGARVMRHVRDPIFGSACRLLDPEARTCTAHEVRPNTCRGHPVTDRCHYYDFLMAERAFQNDPTLQVRAYNVV